MEAPIFKAVKWGNTDIMTEEILNELENSRKETEKVIKECISKREFFVKQIFKSLNIEFIPENLKRITRILPEKHGDFEQYYLDYETENKIHLFSYRLKEPEITKTDNSFKMESCMEFKSVFDLSDIIN